MTNPAIVELDRLIALLEADLPADPKNPKNQRLKKRLESVMVTYFNKLERAFPFSKLEGIYNRYVKESVGSDAEKILDPLLATFAGKLEEDISGELAEIYLSGQAEMITWGKTKGGVPIAYEGPPIRAAIDWAEDHSATLVKGLDGETRRRLALTISKGIENKRGIPGLARDIRTTFADMTKYRSELIARTETASALSRASLNSMADMGIEGKEWITAGDSDVSKECQANAADGIIAVDKTFSSGVLAPPQHPNCRCAVAPSRLKK